MTSETKRGTLDGQTVEGDIDECQECGTEFNQSYGGYYVDKEDLGPDPAGATGVLFKEESEKFGNQWTGFKEEDIGPWCDSCSWVVQQRREIVQNS